MIQKPKQNVPDADLMALVRMIIAADDAAACDALATSPGLATAHFWCGASRETAEAFYLEAIGHYVYAGDTALHVAAAAYRSEVVQKLLTIGANARAKNRRGAEPLHYAADGLPGSRAWNPRQQAATIACLIKAGADPNAPDKGEVTPLHRAVRTRCAAAVKALLEGGADPHRRNKSGSTPMFLATTASGRGGSGSADAKAQQELIKQLLREHVERAGGKRSA